MILEISPEQKAFQQTVEQFATDRVRPQAAAIDEDAAFPRELIREAARLGLMGMTIAPPWGGGGRDYVSYALGIEALARGSAVVAVIAAVNNSLVGEPLEEFGSDSQKEQWLRRIAIGESIGSFALSEEHAGSDAANQQTVARLDERGYVISGRKVWVANAEAADLVVVFAATEPGLRGRGVSAFLVPIDAPGLSRVTTADSLGVRGLGCMDLEFHDVRVGTDALLGAAGDGFRIAMWALDGGRVAIAAQALGVGQAALDEALHHARTHEAFGQPIGNYQAIQWMLADMATELDAARMLTLKAADSRQRHARATLDASMAKLFASEAAHHAADKAMQILASKGYRRGSVVERLFRDVRATEIYQGTSEVQRMVIAEQILQ
ncbi:MAG: acyl-CoA dehydrogenase family protein [Acidobacteria bacterium]|nr:acyl-CoA dehydrogenase family protein [Acidobacteriota bacterium]MCA1650903.1 acyl-CoA dehydrogenase family protein [Acidobacteriota bacterium]